MQKINYDSSLNDIQRHFFDLLQELRLHLPDIHPLVSDFLSTYGASCTIRF